MSLDESIDSLLQRLHRWSAFPKYSLERRFDLFLTPFLEPFFSWKFGKPARLVAPEFPLLNSLGTEGATVDENAVPARTVNVDYLLRLGEGLSTQEREWLFVELKTDSNSFDEDQARLYAAARRREMHRLIADLARIKSKAKPSYRPKYETLLAALPPSDDREPPIRVAYLAPESLRAPVMALEVSPTERAVDDFFSLDELTALDESLIAEADRALWPHVREFLRAHFVDAPAAGSGGASVRRTRE